MPQEYVIRRDFKSRGNWYTKGMIVTEADLENIKYARIKINEGKIRRLPEDEEGLKTLCEYFQVKLGIDLEGILAGRVSKALESAEPIEIVASDPTPPGTTPKKWAKGGIAKQVPLIGDNGSIEAIVPMEEITPPVEVIAPVEVVTPVEETIAPVEQTEAAEAAEAPVEPIEPIESTEPVEPVESQAEQVVSSETTENVTDPSTGG
jgi:hypothetical protein